MKKLNQLNYWWLAAVLVAQTPIATAQTATDRLSLAIAPGEHWWGGVVRDGHLMPFDSPYTINQYANNKGNQIQPLLLSDQGRVIWSEAALEFSIDADSLRVTSFGSSIELISTPAKNLKSAYQYASDTYFPPSGKTPDPLLFAQPQYNTWIELVYNQNQADILKYASDILANGFPPGVLMIDDNWQEDYGKWTFHPSRFPDPKGMMDSLHAMGFKVMLWVCPFLSPDSDVSRGLAEQGLLIKEKDSNEPLMIRWWNGVSSVLDLTNPDAAKWYSSQLDFLTETYGVDGFKFDAGDSYFYAQPMTTHLPNATPNDHTLAFQQFGLDYPLNEYRATWKMGGQPLAQRLHDKGHNWADLQMLVPQMGLQGIMGYPFSCPDMIGGGEFGSFRNLKTVDQELIVRSAQIHALMPMMQFSVAPWRVLDATHLEAVKQTIALRARYLPLILKLVDQATKTGEPVIQLMEYEFPARGYHAVTDQFMVGPDLLVAPVLAPGSTARKVVLPPGKWKWNGQTYSGNRTVEVPVTLGDLPVFSKQ